MDMNTKTAGTKTGAPQAFREMTEKGTTQAKETYEKMSVASTEAADLIQNSYLTAVKGVQDYNNKFFEFAHENTNASRRGFLLPARRLCNHRHGQKWGAQNSNPIGVRP